MSNEWKGYEDTYLVNYLATFDGSDYLKGMDGVEKKTEKSSKNISKYFKAINVAAIYYLGKEALQKATYLGSALKGLADYAGESAIALRGLAAVSTSFGQDVSKATQYAKQLSSDGLITLEQSVRTLKNLISTGFSLEQAFDMSKAMKDVGAFNNVVGDLGQAMEDASKGYKTGSIELIENIGLTQKLSTILDRANVSYKDGINLSTDMEQRRAVYNAILEEGNKFQGNANQLAEEYAGKAKQAEVSVNNLKKAIGENLQPTFDKLNEKIKEVSESATEIISGSAVKKQTTEFNKLRYTVLGLLSEYDSLSDSQKKILEQGYKKLQEQYPSYLKNLKLEKGNYAEIKGVLEKNK